MSTLGQRREHAAIRVEDSATYLIWQAECFHSIDNKTLWDKSVSRRELLKAARGYATAMRLFNRLR